MEHRKDKDESVCMRMCITSYDDDCVLRSLILLDKNDSWMKD
jgi:hypothetical protein